jgi:hypothetical protein
MKWEISQTVCNIHTGTVSALNEDETTSYKGNEGGIMKEMSSKQRK